MATATYNDSVFINCPFDDAYTDFFNALVFTIYRCGFYPRCAKEEDNATQARINKIVKIIKKCRYGIHDISRIELNPAGYPRFNMPYELGLFFGAQRYGNANQKKKNALILEREQFTYQQYISDLNGIDTRAHNNNINTLIQLVRNWLNQASRRTTIPGHNIIIADWEEFYDQLPGLLTENGLDMPHLTYNDLCVFIEVWISRKIAES